MTISKDNKYIKIRGAKEHNLKNVDIDIPCGMMTVFTGPSGSGKSSLVIDVIASEGLRRYVDSMSSYVKQFIGLQNKPKVDSISGLSPSITIDQKTSIRNQRSTVGTITDVYDYFRIFFARVGKPYSSIGKIIPNRNLSQDLEKIFLKSINNNLSLVILIKVVINSITDFKQYLNTMIKIKIKFLIMDDTIYEISSKILTKEWTPKKSIKVIIDQFDNSDEISYKYFIQRAQKACKLGKGICFINTVDHIYKTKDTKYKYIEEIIGVNGFYCSESNIYIESLEPKLFSFNSPENVCKTCHGMGIVMEFSADLIIPNQELSLADGAIIYKGIENKVLVQTLETLAKHYKFNLNQPYYTLSNTVKKCLLYGSDELIEFVFTDFTGKIKTKQSFAGIINSLKDKYHNYGSDSKVKDELEKFLSEEVCPDCKGYRLKDFILSVKVGINHKMHIGNIAAMPIDELMTWIDQMLKYAKLGLNKELETVYSQDQIDKDINNTDMVLIDEILYEVKVRLQHLLDVGLQYLSLNRKASTLSGGEGQRIRLASQISGKLTGVLYILDEPSIGLHQHDNMKLISMFKKLRDLGNTVIIVEHDEDTIRSADYIVDMGPKAGYEGGEIIAHGTIETILKSKNSLTAKYLRGEKFILHNTKGDIVKDAKRMIIIDGITIHNLKSVKLEIPLEIFTVVTGVSGSGKSSLIINTLCNAVMRKLGIKTDIEVGKYKKITGIHNIDGVININQQPIGRTPRSNPATYTGMFNIIRDIFVNLPESKKRNYNISRFSFNVKGGRCETCQGCGFTRISMHFLPDIYVICEMCNGTRYNNDTLEIRYKGKSISDVLNMRIREALEFFKNDIEIYNILSAIDSVGLSYLTLGHPATNLSGGEAQRVKLAKELSKKTETHMLYILDEPTTGLHIDDISRLLKVIFKLIAIGNTVVVIEHNIDVIKTADNIIDIGPYGGNKGGKVVVTGSPRTVSQCKESITGKYLKSYFENENSESMIKKLK